MSIYADLSTADLTAQYNDRSSKSVKVGSYTRAKLITALEAWDTTEKALKAALEARDTPEKALEAPFEIGEGQGVAYPAPAVEGAPEENPAHVGLDKTPVVEEAVEVKGTPTTLFHILKAGNCPFCEGDPANQTAAGEDGTFLGDSARTCHECGKSYNAHTGEEVIVPGEGKSKKRRIMNPQGKINAKMDALAKESIDAAYDRTSRLWVFERGFFSSSMTSKEFSAYTPAELTSHLLVLLSDQAPADKPEEDQDDAAE